jgi:hypothetical protein
MIDRIRIGLAVLRYDAWLDLTGGVPGRQRRELRRELRANLEDAAAQVGAREAVRRLGPIRALAAEAAAATRAESRPSWNRGALVAGKTVAAVLVLELLAVVWWTGAAHASGNETVRGGLALFPGSMVEYSRIPGGESLSVRPGWLFLAAAAAAFTLASRPWLLRHRATR